MKTLDIMAIPLSQGMFALVDGRNYEWLRQWKWSVSKQAPSYYATRRIWNTKTKRQKTIIMHREILGLKHGDGIMTDHANHCGLDNREVNIRVCTNRQNQGNGRFRKDNKSGYKGVSWQAGKWLAQIRNQGKVTYIGSFNNKVEAAKAYDAKAKEIFGEFAYVNFPVLEK